MTTLPWHLMTPLQPQPDRDFSQDDDLRQQWFDRRSDIANAGLTALHRSWAIETGITEGLYWLDDDQTRTLIQRGFVPAEIPLSGTGQDPDNLLAILRDHMAALDAIYGEVQRGRSISRSAIRQLHQVIVAHQPTYRAMNQFGQQFDATLHAGAFKTLPNNPTPPDGVLHQYCPPIHVASEIDDLLNWYADYCAQPDAYHPRVTTPVSGEQRYGRIRPVQRLEAGKTTPAGAAGRPTAIPPTHGPTDGRHRHHHGQSRPRPGT